MDITRASIRQLEENGWKDYGAGFFGYATGCTSPKYDGHVCYGPFQEPLRQGCCVFLEFWDASERMYIFAVRGDSSVTTCVCPADAADAYVMDIRRMEETWSRSVGTVVEFATIADAANGLRAQLSHVTDWQDRGCAYARETHAWRNDATSELKLRDRVRAD